MPESPRIQVLISAYGPSALRQVASLRHDRHQGVEFIVGWQNSDGFPIPEEISSRDDFKVIRLDSTGLCNNRNALLKAATAPVVMIADDDLEYENRHFDNIIAALEKNPDVHFLTFRYESAEWPKNYPVESFDLRKPPRNYFVTSMEMVFNMERIRRDYGSAEAVWFNPAFGVNGTSFGSGEEAILICSLLRRGMRGRFIPSDICRNTDSTTSERIGTTRGFIETKGASVGFIKPRTALLRMLTHAWRASQAPNGERIPFVKYCRWWLSGVRKARKHKVFEK